METGVGDTTPLPVASNQRRRDVSLGRVSAGKAGKRFRAHMPTPSQILPLQPAAHVEIALDDDEESSDGDAYDLVARCSEPSGEIPETTAPEMPQEPPTPAKPSPPRRRIDLDRLMVLLTYCLAIFHYHRAFDISPYMTYIGPGKSTVFSYFAEVLSMTVITWLLPLFFAISGMSTNAALSVPGRGVLYYAKERTLRILVPAVFALFLIMIPELYIVYQYHDPIEFFPWYANFLKSTFNLSRAWFLCALYAYSLLHLPLFTLYRSASRGLGVPRWQWGLIGAIIAAAGALATHYGHWSMGVAVVLTYVAFVCGAMLMLRWRWRMEDEYRRGVMALTLLAIFFVCGALSFVGPETATAAGSSDSAFENWTGGSMNNYVLLLVYFASFFVAGFVINMFETGIVTVLRTHARGLKWAMPILFPLAGLLLPRLGSNSGFYYAIVAVPCYYDRWQRVFLYAFTWVTSFSMYGIAVVAWGTDTRMTKLLALLRKSAMWVFLVHYTPESFLMAVLQHSIVPAWARWLLILLGTAAFCAVTFVIVDSNPVTRFMFGLKGKRSKLS